MSASNILLLNPINVPLEKESIADYASMGLFHNQSSCKSNAMTGSLLCNMHKRRPQLLSHHIDPILRLRQIDADTDGIRNHIPLPTNQDRSDIVDSERSDSQTGTKNSCGVLPVPALATVDGETVSKIRSEFNACGPLMTLVHVLRDSWNDANLAGFTPHHKNQNNSHNTNSKEELHQKMASTMTALPLPTEYLPSRRVNFTSVPRGHCSSRSRRIRSRSIAIKRPTSEEQLEEIRQNSLAAEYDWATWRMYNRIIEYRQKHPLPHNNEDSATSLEATSSALINIDGPDSTSDCTVIDDENQSLQEEKLQQHYPEYGEVFDLDL